MEKNYLTEAFKALEELNEDVFDISFDDGLDDAKEYMEEPVDDREEEIIIDPLADTEEDLEDDYLGKAILQCEICKSMIYKNPDEVIIDEEEDLANVEDVCPFCQSQDGFKVIGEIKEFCEDGECEEEHKEDIEETEEESKEDSEEIEETEEVDEDGDLDESIKTRRRVRLKEENDNEDLKEETNYEKVMRTLDMLDESTKLDDIDADADDKKEKAKADYEKVKDDADADRDYKLKRKGLKESRNEKFWVLVWKVKEYDDEFTEEYNDYDDARADFIDFTQNNPDDFKYVVLQEVTYENGYENIDELEVWGDVYESCESKKSKKSLKESDKPAATSMEDAQKWVDFDMKKYGKISERTNRLVKKAGFQILKDDHGDYEVAAGKFESCEESLQEDFSKVDIETDREKMSMTADENGKVTVTTEPIENVEEKVEGEIIAPVTDEIKAEFKTEDELKEPVEEPEYSDIEFDEFEEEDFNELGESYLKRVYENVESFKTIGGAIKGNNLKLEGLITFKSGKQAKTSFVFESYKATKTGMLKFIGENKQFAKGKKSFTLTGRADGKKLVCEALTYNYKAQTPDGKSKRLYGTIKK